MCGIAGIIWQGCDPPPRDAVGRMASTLQHRGPDATATTRRPGCDLAHTRLAIIDPVGGDQPMGHPQHPSTIVFNGEIYNHVELRKTLEHNNDPCTTSSDTEVLLRMLVAQGPAALDRLNGQFAFGLWNADERRLLAARDRLGEKPFYYAIDNAGRFIFASEIKAILASGLIQPTVRRAAIQSVLGLMHTQPHETIYQELHALPPGQTLTWHRGKIATHAYWSPRYAWRNDITPNEAAGEVRRLLEAAVDRQRLADVPVGALLSGGLDSSTIVGILAGQNNSPAHTFAAGFGDLIDELPYARAVAKQYHTDHHELQLDAMPVEQLLPQMARVYDEPFADSSALPTYLLCEFASRHVKAVLTGDGADELFGGYGWTRPLLLAESCRPGKAFDALRWLGWQVRRAIAKAMPGYSSHALTSAAHFTAGREKSREQDPWQRRVNQATEIDPQAIDQHHRPDANLLGIDRATDFDLRVYLPGDILTKVDRAAMAHGLETRSPFLDVDLVEFVLSLPPSQRLTSDETKPLLRQSCADLWPQSLHSRRKQGFGAPIQAYLGRPAVQQLWQRTTGSDSPLREAIGPTHAWLESPNAQHRWRLLSVGLWLEQHASRMTNDTTVRTAA